MGSGLVLRTLLRCPHDERYSQPEAFAPRRNVRADARRRQSWLANRRTRDWRPGDSKILDMFEKLETENGALDRRLRIEHAQRLSPLDIPRFCKLHVVASVQPYHAIDDGRWADKRIGSERAKTTYAFRSLLDAGAVLAFGSDWFVAPMNPLVGIYAAVTRRALDGKNP